MEKKSCFFEAQNLQMDGGKDQVNGKLTKDELDSLSGEKGDIDKKLAEHLDAYKKQQIPKEEESIKKALNLKQEEKLPDSVQTMLDTFKGRLDSLKQESDYLAQINKIIINIEKTVQEEIDKRKTPEQNLQSYLEGESTKKVENVLTIIDAKAQEINEKNKGKKGTLLDQVISAFSEGGMSEIIKFVTSLFRSDAELGRDIPEVEDESLAETALATDKELQGANNEDFASRLLLAGTRTEAQWRLYKKGYEKREIQADSFITTERGEKFEDVLIRFMKSQEPAKTEADAKMALLSMKHMGLPVIQGEIPKGTILYFSKDGLLVDASKEQKDLKEVSRIAYEKTQKDRQISMLEYMEKDLQIGDFILIRGNTSSIEGKIARGGITAQQGGFGFTHIMTYLGKGKVFNMNLQGGGHEADLGEIMMDSKLTTGDYVTLKNSANTNAEGKKKIPKFIEYLKTFTGKRYEQEGLKNGALGMNKEGTVDYKGKQVKDHYDICTGTIQEAMEYAGMSNFDNTRTVEPRKFFDDLDILNVGNVR